MSFLKDYQAMGKASVRDIKRNFKPLLWICVFLIASIFIIALANGTAQWLTSFDLFHHDNTTSAAQAHPTPADPTLVAVQNQATASALAIQQAQSRDQATASAIQMQATASVIQAQSQATASAIFDQQARDHSASNQAQADAPFWDSFGKLFVAGIFVLLLLLIATIAVMGVLRDSHRRKLSFIEAHKLRPDANGNYETYLTPAGQLVQPTPGNIVQPVPYNYSPNFSQSKNYAPHLIIKNDAPPATAQLPSVAASVAPVLPVTPEIPGPLDFVEILARFQPQPDKIFLALGPGAEQRVVSSKRLFNIALAGATRQGKTSILRMMLAQLLFCGAKIYLTDPKYTDFDVEADEDWRPIRDKLARPPAYLIEDIERTIRWISSEEIPSRLERRRRGQRLGQPIFLAIDELPWIVDKWPEATTHISEILRIGAGLGVMVIGAAQDFLVSTIGGSGAVRDCYRTAFYVGGDDKTGRVLLDLQGTKGPVDDGTLGRGVALLRSDGKSAERVRIPFMSNEALYTLLGKPENPFVYKDTAQERPGQQTVEPAESMIFNADIEAASTASVTIPPDEQTPVQQIIITPLPAAPDAMTARAEACYYPGISIAQLARAAGCSESTAAQVIRRLKKKQPGV